MLTIVKYNALKELDIGKESLYGYTQNRYNIIQLLVRVNPLQL